MTNSEDGGPRRTAEAVVGREAGLAALQRALASAPFARARQSAGFLAFVATETLADRGDRLHERSIALQAMGRGSGYDPRQDASVRVQASRVRSALRRYYETEGATDPIRISLEPGSYVPQFARHQPRAALTAGQLEPLATPDLIVALFDENESEHLGNLSAISVSESLADELGQVPGLRVRGPVDLRLDGNAPDLVSAGQRLGATYILSGDIRADPGHARLSVWLTDVTQRRVVWSESLSRPLNDFAGFRGEQQIMSRIAEAIGDYGGVLHRVALSAPADQLPQSFRATASFYRFVDASDAETRDIAMADLRLALADEPDNADLLAMLASCHLVGAMQGLATDRPSEMRNAATLAHLAVELDATGPRAHNILAMLSLAQADRAAALRQSREAVTARQPCPSTLMAAGIITLVAGDWDTGIEWIRELSDLNPGHPGRQHLYLALDRLIAGEDASALVEASLIAQPMSSWGPLLRGLALAALGCVADASRELSDAEAAQPGFVNQRDFAQPQFWDIPEVARTMLLQRCDALPADVIVKCSGQR